MHIKYPFTLNLVDHVQPDIFGNFVIFLKINCPAVLIEAVELFKRLKWKVSITSPLQPSVRLTEMK